MIYKSHADHIWRANGEPAGKWKMELASDCCVTCGCALTEGVPVDKMLSDSFSQHADYLRFGTHLCPACNWFFSYPKLAHRNVIAAGDKAWWPMVSWDSATVERPCWYDVLTEVSKMSPDTPVSVVMTVDPKPRLWPRTTLCTVSSFGAYLHWPDYDRSFWVSFDLKKCLEIADFIIGCLERKFSKRAVYFSLVSDLKKFKKDPKTIIQLEKELSVVRKTNEFLPALLIAGVKKEVLPDAEVYAEPEAEIIEQVQPVEDESVSKEFEQVDIFGG